MSKARKSRYGWTKESWRSYKEWASDYAFQIHHAAARRVTAQLIALGGWSMFEWV